MVTTIRDLIGVDLSEFSFVEMTEVCNVNEEGIRLKSIGVFKNTSLAKAYAGLEKDKHYLRVREKVLILTNGTIGFLIDNAEKITLFDDEEKTAEIRNRILQKLTPEDREVLGI